MSYEPVRWIGIAWRVLTPSLGTEHRKHKRHLIWLLERERKNHLVRRSRPARDGVQVALTHDLEILPRDQKHTNRVAMIRLILRLRARTALTLQHNTSKTRNRLRSRHRADVLASSRAASARGRGLAARCSPPYTLSRIIVSAHGRIPLRVCANAFWEERTRYELTVLYQPCSTIIRKTLSVLL
jgi:hypothetical protein